MPDIASISGAISAVKAATDIAKVLRDLNATVQSADLKLKIAELTDALANAKLALIEVHEVVLEKDAEINRLSAALKVRGEVVRHGDSYFLVNQSGAPTGDPYCSHCFEVKHSLVHINQNPKSRVESVCPNCKNVFHWQRRQNPDAPSA